MQKIQIANPERLNEFKFQIDGDPFVTKWVGTNPLLSGDNICWFITNKNDITNEYRISLMRVAESDEDGREIKHRVIIKSAKFATSRQIFVYGSTLWDMAEFSTILMRNVMQFEDKNLPF